MKSILFSVTLGLAIGSANIAAAQIDEVRVGTNIHDIDWTGLGSGGDKERSIALNGEVVFDSPDFLKWAFAPRPYLGAALNLEGKTSHGGGGLLWRKNLGDKFYLNFGFGLAIHDGTLEARPSDLVVSVFEDPTIASTLTDAQIEQFGVDIDDFMDRATSEIDFGSRVLFREQIALGYRWSEDWSVHIFAEHLSNGKIFVQDAPNEGLDTLGLRLARHF